MQTIFRYGQDIDNSNVIAALYIAVSYTVAAVVSKVRDANICETCTLPSQPIDMYNCSAIAVSVVSVPRNNPINLFIE